MSDEVDTARVPRPSVPPLTWAVVGAWLAIVCAQNAVWAAVVAGREFSAAWVLWVLAAGAAGTWLLARKGRRFAGLMLAAVCAGACIGLSFWIGWRADVSALASDGGSRIVEVLSDETVGAFGSSSLCRLCDGRARGAIVQVEWPAHSAAPPVGRRVRLVGSVRAATLDEWGLRACRAAEVGTVRARSVADEGWAPTIRGFVGPSRLWAVDRMAAVPGSAGDLLAGVVLGDRRRLAGTTIEADFRTTGLSHLIAVSGSHLIVVAVVVTWLLARLRTRRSIRAVLVGAVVGVYVVFTGIQVSAVRAWLMAVTVALAGLTGRRTDSASALAVTAGAMLLFAPNAVFELGFQLSVVAVMGLSLLGRLAETWTRHALPRGARAVAAPISMTAVAVVATLPVTVPAFGMVSLVAPVANLLVGPLVACTLVCGLAALGVGSVWPGGGDAALRLSAAPSAWAAGVAHWLANWPHAAVPLGTSAWTAGLAVAAGACGLWLWWPNPTRMRARLVGVGVLAATAALALGPPVVGSGPSIEMLDVGQGDAILLRDGPHAVLVDTGPAPGALRAAIARAGLRDVDAVVITHLHADHYGGLPGLKGLVRVPFVVVPAGSLHTQSAALDKIADADGGTPGREVLAGATLTCGRLAATVVSPRSPVDNAATNEASIVMLVRDGRFSALLTGDAESGVLEPLVAAGVLGDVDVLKVGHHGSDEAVSPQVLAALRPEWGFISVGAGNRYGHPTASTLRLLSSSGTHIERTDQVGDVTVLIGADGSYRVATARRTAAATSPQQAVCWARRRPSLRRGAAMLACATLDAISRPIAWCACVRWEPDGQGTVDIQAGLSHLRRPRSPPRARARSAETQRRRSGGPRLQLRNV